VIHAGRARLTRADLDARDALMARLFEERGGREALDIVSQLRIEDYATAQIQLGKVQRRLELVGAVSTAGNERVSLVDTYTAFSARVERLAAELPPPVARASTLPGLPDVPTSALHVYRDLVHRLANGETLSDFERGQLSLLRSAADGFVQKPPDTPPPPRAEPAASPIVENASPSVEGPPPSPDPPPVVCAFCSGPCVGRAHPLFGDGQFRPSDRDASPCPPLFEGDRIAVGRIQFDFARVRPDL
jgi:hypothetical protein